MTCAIVWRSEDQIHLASDSRITFRTGAEVGRYADVGVKVMSLKIGVIDANSTPNLLFDGDYGFCYAGSLASGSTFKNLIEDILKSFQFIGAEVNVSFDQICEYIKRISGTITQLFFEELLGKEDWQFVICGYCPLNRVQKAALFTFSYFENIVTANFSEVASKNGDFQVIGQGTRKIDSELNGEQLSAHKVLCSLHNLIQNSDFPGVGGDLQYGLTNETRFSVNGIVLIQQTTHDNGDGTLEVTEIDRIYCYRGLRLMGEDLIAHPLNSAVFPSGIRWTPLTLTLKR
jgi:hypothetical protein